MTPKEVRVKVKEVDDEAKGTTKKADESADEGFKVFTKLGPKASGLVRDASGLVRDASGLVRDASGLVCDASGLVRGSLVNDFDKTTEDAKQLSKKTKELSTEIDVFIDALKKAKNLSKAIVDASGLVRKASKLARDDSVRDASRLADAFDLVRDASGLVKNASGIVKSEDKAEYEKIVEKKVEELEKKVGKLEKKVGNAKTIEDASGLVRDASGLVRDASGLVR